MKIGPATQDISKARTPLSYETVVASGVPKAEIETYRDGGSWSCRMQVGERTAKVMFDRRSKITTATFDDGSTKLLYETVTRTIEVEED